jgi:hypothetical protein
MFFRRHSWRDDKTGWRRRWSTSWLDLGQRSFIRTKVTAETPIVNPRPSIRRDAGLHTLSAFGESSPLEAELFLRRLVSLPGDPLEKSRVLLGNRRCLA